MLMLDLKLWATGLLLGYAFVATEAVTCITAVAGTTGDCTTGCAGTYMSDATDVSSPMCQKNFQESTNVYGYPTSTEACIGMQNEDGKSMANCYCKTDSCNKMKKADLADKMKTDTDNIFKNDKKDSNRKCYMQSTGATDAGSSTTCLNPSLMYCYLTKTTTNTTTSGTTTSTVTYSKGCASSGSFKLKGSGSEMTVSPGYCKTVTESSGDTKTIRMYCTCAGNDCNKNEEMAMKGATAMGATIALIGAALIGQRALA